MATEYRFHLDYLTVSLPMVEDHARSFVHRNLIAGAEGNWDCRLVRENGTKYQQKLSGFGVQGVRKWEGKVFYGMSRAVGGGCLVTIRGEACA